RRGEGWPAGIEILLLPLLPEDVLFPVAALGYRPGVGDDLLDRPRGTPRLRRWARAGPAWCAAGLEYAGRTAGEHKQREERKPDDEERSLHRKPPTGAAARWRGRTSTPQQRCRP